MRVCRTWDKALGIIGIRRPWLRKGQAPICGMATLWGKDDPRRRPICAGPGSAGKEIAFSWNKPRAPALLRCRRQHCLNRSRRSS